MKPTLSVAISVALVVILVTFSVATIHPAQAKLLVVGTYIPYPPFEYAQVGSVGGFDMDLARYVAKQSGYQDIVVKVMAFTDLVPALESGQIDLIASGLPLNYSDDPNIAYSVPYWEASQSVIVSSQRPFRPTRSQDLVGKNVAAIDLISQRRLVKTELYGVVGASGNYTACGDPDEPCVHRYSSLVEALEDLQEGRLDAVVIDTPVAHALTSLYPVSFGFKLYEGTQYAFAVRKDDVRLLSSVNAALKAYIGTPEWDKMVFADFRS